MKGSPMPLTVFFAVLFAALLHASWNALIKQGGPKLRGMFILTLVQGGIGVVIASLQPLPQGEVWLWLLASGVFHSAYKVFLAFAYEQGDLSRVYPIARGAAPMFVLVLGAILLSDVIRGQEYFAVFVLGIGIVLMAWGALQSGGSRKLVPLALLSAMATAGYSMVDGSGARVWGNPTAYVAWLFIFDALMFSVVVIGWRGVKDLRGHGRDWRIGSLAAAASYGAYAIAVWAMTQAPIALVTALRETSILFAVLIGWLIFGEQMGRTKAIAACLIVAGVVLTRI